MRIAAEFIRGQGGIASARVFTHLWLALFGLWSWDAVPALPTEIVLLPPRFPFNVYDFACWARQTIVALCARQSAPARAAAAVRPRRARTAAADRCRRPTSSRRERERSRRAGVLRRARPPAARSTNTTPSARCAASRCERAESWIVEPPGGRRLLGRDPAALGLLADRAEPRGLPARPSRDATRPRGHRGLHGRGPRRRATTSARRRARAGGWKRASRRSGTRRLRWSR